MADLKNLTEAELNTIIDTCIKGLQQHEGAIVYTDYVILSPDGNASKKYEIQYPKVSMQFIDAIEELKLLKSPKIWNIPLPPKNTPDNQNQLMLTKFRGLPLTAYLAGLSRLYNAIVASIQKTKKYIQLQYLKAWNSSFVKNVGTDEFNESVSAFEKLTDPNDSCQTNPNTFGRRLQAMSYSLGVIPNWLIPIEPSMDEAPEKSEDENIPKEASMDQASKKSENGSVSIMLYLGIGAVALLGVSYFVKKKARKSL